MKHLIETIEELWLRGIGSRGLTEALGTMIAQGRLVIHMLGALAEFERSLIRERPEANLPPRGGLATPEAVRRNSRTTTSRPPRRCLPIPTSPLFQIAQRLGVSPATFYGTSLPHEPRIPRRFDSGRPRRYSQ